MEKKKLLKRVMAGFLAVVMLCGAVLVNFPEGESTAEAEEIISEETSDVLDVTFVEDEELLTDEALMAEIGNEVEEVFEMVTEDTGMSISEMTTQEFEINVDEYDLAVGQSYSGECVIYCSSSSESDGNATFKPVFTSGILQGYNVTSYSFYCQTHGAANPISRSGTYTATVRSIGDSTVTFYVLCTPEGWTGTVHGYQQVGGTITVPYNPTGEMQVQKIFEVSSNWIGESMNYSVENAIFGVYATEAQARAATVENNQWEQGRVGILVTDSTGYSNVLELDKGVYYVKEVQAPKGCKLNDEVYLITVTSGQKTTFQAKDELKMDPAVIEIYKEDSDGATETQGSASMAGAQFTVKYYNVPIDQYANATAEEMSALPATRTWVVETKERVDSTTGEVKYFALVNEDYKVSGDDFFDYYMLPYGVITIEETEAPEGYLPSDEVFVGVITEGESPHLKVGNEATESIKVTEEVVRGGVQIKKRDYESGQTEALGSATLEGAEFTIRNNSKNAVVVNGETFETGEDIMTITTDEDGIAKTDTDTLPYGTYAIWESKTPTGYKADPENAKVHGFEIREDGVLVDMTDDSIEDSYTKGSGVNAAYNQVIRGDLELIKIGGGDTNHERLAGVPFKITSTTTGESHIIVTDENGCASTASAWNPHSQNTNAGETADDGVWFGEYDGGTVSVDDSLGALPYDTYTIEELACEANANYDLIEPFEVTIKRNNYVVPLGTLTDTKNEIKLDSVATSTDGEKVVCENSTCSLVDSVLIEGLAKGQTYTLVGKQVLKSTGDVLATSTTTFEAEKTNQTITQEFEVTLGDCGGDSIVTFEYLYLGDTAEGQTEIAIHEDLDDEDQTVEVEEIVISGNIDKKQTIANTDSERLREAAEKGVALTDIEVNDTYYYTIDYCSTSNVYADELNMTDPLDSVNAGLTRLQEVKTPVSFDDYDSKMNVWYQTNKTDTSDTTDSAQYNACEEGVTRQLDYTGWKLWKADVSTLESEVLKVEDLGLDEDEYVIGLRFEHGRVEAGFTTRSQEESELDSDKQVHDDLEEVTMDQKHDVAFDLSAAKNKNVARNAVLDYEPTVLQMQIIDMDRYVAGEELWNSAEMDIYRDGMKDEDEDKVVQEYRQIEIHTEATNSDDGTKVVLADGTARIADKVTLKGLEVGKTYTLKANEMLKSENAALVVDGQEVTGETTFTAESEEQEVYVALNEFNANDLGGQDVVTFEKLYSEDNPDVPVATHEDIDDEGQTISIVTPEEYVVKTGDRSNVGIMFGLAMLSGGLLAGVVYRKRKAEKEDKAA